MNLKRILCILAAVALPLLLSSCVNRYKDVRITSASPVSVGLNGTDGISLLFEVGIDNPAPAFELTDILITVYNDGTDLVTLESDGLIVEAKCHKTYQIPFKGRFSENLSFSYLMQYIGRMPDPEKLTASFRATVAPRGGVGKVIELHDLPLKDIIDEYSPE